MTGQELIERWVAFIRRYVVMTEQQALVVALWAVHTWIYERFGATPYLEIAAVTKRSGKTTMLDVLALLTRGAEQYAIVRILSLLAMASEREGKVTVLFDEAEQFSRSNLGETRQALATGYRVGAQHGIRVGKEYVRYSTFFPKAFALIGNVHDVLRDRCIELELERGKPERVLSEWREHAQAEAADLVVALVDVSKRAGRVPMVPAEWLHARERELWTPIVSTATWLGLHAATMRTLEAASVDMGLLKLQPAKVWHSAQDEQDADERDAAERVLADMQAVMMAGEAFVPSSVLVDRLRAIPTAPWRAWRGNGINEMTLSTLLDRYGIQAVRGQIGKGRKDRQQVRGYRAADVRREKKA